MVIVVAIGVCAYFTDGFESEFKTFYATVNGKDVMNSSGGYILTPENPMAVDVKYTFGAFNKEETKDYSYKIVPNKNAEGNLEFRFGYDGRKEPLSARFQTLARYSS